MTREEEVEAAWALHTNQQRPYTTMSSVRRGWLQEHFECQHGECAYCRSPMTMKYECTNPLSATVDHLIPRGRGGPDTFANTVAACRDCNSRKGSMLPAEFIYKMTIDKLDRLCYS